MLNFRNMKGNKYYTIFLTIILCMNFISCEKDNFSKKEYNIHIDEPGTLRLLIPSEEDFGGNYKSLKLTGQINQEDLDDPYVRVFMQSAETTDMKEVSVVEGERLDGTKTPKNVITGLGLPGWHSGNYSGTLILPKDLEEYWGGGSGIKNITFPNTLRILGDFNNSTATSIVLPNSVTEIGDGTFMCCNELASITLSTNLVKIGDYALSGTSITNITIPDEVTEIGWSVFDGCKKLQEVWLPQSLKEIGDKAFYNCPMLKKIHIKAPIPPTNKYKGDLFDSSSYIELFVPKGSRELYRNDPLWNVVRYITEE